MKFVGIFLDIDGVLNTKDYHQIMRSNGLCSDHIDIDNLLDPRCLVNLGQIVTLLKECDLRVDIVLSSDRRYSYQYAPVFRSILDGMLALVHLRVEGVTPHIAGADRTLEITTYLESNAHLDYCLVLDDIIVGGFTRFQVRCDPNVGLTEDDVQKAVSIVKLQMEGPIDE